jgi:hypothetical protein
MSIVPHITIGTEIMNGLSTIGEHATAVEGGAIAINYAAKGIGWLVSAIKTRLPFFERHYLGTSEGAQIRAAANVLSVGEKVREKLDAYIQEGRLTEQQAQEALDDPAFAVFLNTTLLHASETDDTFTHEQFASLVVERMTKSSTSSDAIALRIAAERLHDLTPRQLKALGAAYAATYVNFDGLLGL